MSAVNLEFTIAGRDIKFMMSVDADNLADQEMLKALRISGCPEPEVANLMARVAKPGAYMVDGGANIGFFTVFLSQLVGKDGYVYAFEPGANNLHKLRENVKLNKCENVEVVAKPLWNKFENVQLHMCADGSKNSLAPHADTRGAALMGTAVLDDYATEDALRNISLIKLDIEGAEEAALRGGKSFLIGTRCPYIVVELNIEALPKFGSSPAKVCDFLRDYGYNPFLLHPDGALPTYIPRRTKVNPTRLNWNVLFSTTDMVSAAWPEIEA